ncbi:SDR family oxidoreductase [Mesoterricola sediminis]|uniref:NAD(P)-dependent oxidoreductase n=1 Tax=Mesoterricola sediminis TaxID=2927980 RepID=A0AA48GVI1_9BACT|nr:SDR family oxidoreductase [Mesoterricola sediminis]BDU75165.1 NAD(P)-dependent oxidoreductase [Mesoterricola sediminis]
MPSPETSTRPVETPRPPFPEQQQQLPGSDQALSPQADHGETSYRGHGRLEGKAALITGGDSGIGKAVAIAFAREGADVLVSYLEAEEADAKDTARWITEAGRKAVLVPGDLSCPDTCAALVARAVEAFGKLDVLVNNAAHQRTFASLEDLTTEELEHTFKVNILAMFHLCKAALPHLRPGASIINTSSREAFTPRPDLLAYATTKGAIATFTKSLAGLLADRGIRVNAVAPGPVWTPLIPASMTKEEVSRFGTSTPWGRPAQPVELAPVYVMLASDESSYISSSIYEVTGGRPVS